MKKVIKTAKTVLTSLVSYDAASKKFGYRLYSKEFIDNQDKNTTVA